MTTQPPPSDVDEQGDLAGLFTSLDELSNTVSMLGDTVVAFRNHNNLLLSELRRHNLDVPDTSPSDPRFRRALEAIHELKPVPSCIMPDPATGEYTPIEARYRRLVFLGTERISGVALEDRWRNRSAFVRDLERLEQLRLHLGPQPASNNRPEPGLDQTRLLIEYGALLNKLMPDNWHFTPDETGAMRSEWSRSAVIGSFDRELMQETMFFSLLSIATERDVRQSLESIPGRAVRVMLGDYRHNWFVNAGIFRHYVASESQVGGSSTAVPIPQAFTVESPARQREVSSSRPSEGSMWQPGMSPFRSSAAESQSMRVSWFEESPRGANAEALLDPEYLQWRQEQDGPSRFNSPRAMGGASPTVSTAPVSAEQNRQSFVNRDRDTLTQLPRAPGMDELVRPPQNREPDLHPEQMSRRGETHEGISSELQPLISGPQAQAEASRQFPRQAIHDRSVQTSANAMGARVIRMLRNSLHRRRSQ